MVMDVGLRVVGACERALRMSTVNAMSTSTTVIAKIVVMTCSELGFFTATSRGGAFRGERGDKAGGCCGSGSRIGLRADHVAGCLRDIANHARARTAAAAASKAPPSSTVHPRAVAMATVLFMRCNAIGASRVPLTS